MQSEARTQGRLEPPPAPIQEIYDRNEECEELESASEHDPCSDPVAHNTRLAEAMAELEIIEKRITRDESDEASLRSRITDLHKAVEKAEKKRSKAMRKREAAQNDDSDSDSDHRNQLMRMHTSALEKARNKYQRCQDELADATNSLDEAVAHLAEFQKERVELQRRVDLISQEEEESAKQRAEAAAQPPWQCKCCLGRERTSKFCPDCGAARVGCTVQVRGLTPRLDALEARIDARIDAKVFQSFGSYSGIGPSICSRCSSAIEDSGIVNDARGEYLEEYIERTERIKRITKQRLEQYRNTKVGVSSSIDPEASLQDEARMDLQPDAIISRKLPTTKPCE